MVYIGQLRFGQCARLLFNMGNCPSAFVKITEDACSVRGSRFKFLQCKFCSLVSEKVAKRDSGPSCPRCYTLHTSVPLVTVYTQVSNGENDTSADSSGSMSADSFEDDSNSNLVIDESTTDTTTETEEISSADDTSSVGYRGESDDSETYGSDDTDHAYAVDMNSSDNEELLTDHICFEVESCGEPEREGPEEVYECLEVTSMSETFRCPKVNENTNTLNSQKRKSSNSVIDDEDKKGLKKHKSNEGGDDVMPDGIYHFVNQEKKAIAEGAFIDVIYGKHDDVNSRRQKSPHSLSDEGFVSEKSILPESSNWSDRVSPDVFSALIDSAADSYQDSDTESVWEERSSGVQSDGGVDGDMSSSDDESDSYGSCFSFKKYKFRFGRPHVPQDVRTLATVRTIWTRHRPRPDHVM